MPDPQDASGVAEASRVRDRLTELLGSGSARESMLVARLVDGFPAKATGLLDGALAAAGAGDAAGATLRIHRLRGAAADLGAVALPSRCEEAEGLAGAGDCEQVLRCGPHLRRGIDELALALAGVAAGLPLEKSMTTSAREA